MIYKFNKFVNESKKLKLPTFAKKELLNFVNSDKSYRNLYSDTISELKKLPVRPDENVVLYRGLLFKKYHLEEGKFGFNFLNNIEKGTDIINLSLDKVSSWTYSIDIAENFARYRSATDNYSATLSFLQRGNDAIDGELGVIISVIAKPENIVVDLNLLDNIGFFKHGNEDECILDVGNYLCKVVKMYNKKGEINVKEFFNTNNNFEQYDKIYSQIKKVIKNLNIKINTNYSYNFHYYSLSFEEMKYYFLNYDKLSKQVDTKVEELKNIFVDFKPVEYSTVLDINKKKIIKEINSFYSDFRDIENDYYVKYVKNHVNSLSGANQYAEYFQKKLGLKKFSINRYTYEKKTEFNKMLASDFGFDNYNTFKEKLKDVLILIEKISKLYKLKKDIIEI